MKNLEYYYNYIHETNDHHLHLVEREVGGGRISSDRIDTIGEYPNQTSITISGLTQKTFEYFVSKFGKRFKSVRFWKCPLVNDLTPLEDLQQIEYIIYFWNQRATRLWDLSKNHNLIGLAYDDFTRMHSLEDLTKSKSLEELLFGDKVWCKYVLESLSPLKSCKNLRRLGFSAKKIIKHDITPLAQIKNLSQIEFSFKLFKTEEIAWLTAHLPKSIKSTSLRPYHRIENPLEFDGKKRDTIIIGKGKPFLDSRLDAEAIQKYTKKFEALVEEFSLHPTLKP